MKKFFILAVMLLASSVFARSADGPGNSGHTAAADIDLNDACIGYNSEDPLLDSSGSFILQCRSLEVKGQYIGTIAGGGGVYSHVSPETMVIVEIKNGKCKTAQMSETQINRFAKKTVYSGKIKFKNGGVWTYELNEDGPNSNIVQKDQSGKVVGDGPFDCK